MALWVGYAQAVITPSLERPVYLAGFGQNRLAESVHDDLYVRALALQHGDTRLVAAALDLIGLGRQHCLEVAQRISEQSPGTRTWLASTHTHHGPDTIGFWGPDLTTPGVDPAYLASLKEQVVRTVLAAAGRLAPALFRSTSVQVTGLAKNARDPEVLDEELTCLQFLSPAGESAAVPLATWLIYPCHPEVLWEKNAHITSDYVGALRLGVEALTGTPCLAMVGAIGGMMTPDVEEHSFAEAEQMGQTLAQAAVGALATRPAEPVERMNYSCQEFVIPMTNPLFHMAIEAGLLADLLSRDGSVTSEANLLRLDSTWVLGVPGELLPKLGLAFKAEMQEAGAAMAAVVGLTNDEVGYILPQAEYIYPENPFEPGDHYEETMSLGADVAPCLQGAVRELLQRGVEQAK
jgi:hypothetical protein